MKKGVKITFAILGIMFLVGSIGRCASGAAQKAKTPREKFLESVERANADCPIPVAGGIGQVTSIKVEDINIDSTRTAITYYLDYKKDQFKYDLFKSNPEGTKALFYLAFKMMNGQGGNGDMLYDTMTKYNVAMKCVINKGKDTELSVVLTPAYLKKMSENDDSKPSEALLAGIKIQMEMARTELPLQIDEGITITGIQIQGNNIIYEALCDETMYDIDAIRESSEMVADEMLRSASSDTDMCATLDLCKVSHTGLIYVFRGKQSGKTAQVEISSDIIRAQHITPAQASIY